MLVAPAAHRSTPATERGRGHKGARTGKGRGAGQWGRGGRGWDTGHRGLRGPTEASLLSWLGPPISTCSMALYNPPRHSSQDPESQGGAPSRHPPDHNPVGSTRPCPSRGTLGHLKSSLNKGMALTHSPRDRQTALVSRVLGENCQRKKGEVGWGQLNKALNAMFRQAYEKGGHARWGMIRAVSKRPLIWLCHLAQKGSKWLKDRAGGTGRGLLETC